MSVLTAASRRFLGLATVLFLLFTLVPTLGAAGSAEDGGDFEIIIPVSTVVRGPEGSEIVLVQLPTPTDLVGATCEITAMSENQSSVHPDNDLMVSGVLIPDVEGEPGGTVTANDVVVLGPNIVISLLMGPDGVFSAGLTVGFKCTSVAATSTTTTTTTGQTTTTTASSEPITTGSSSTTVLVSGSDVTTTSLETEVKGIQILPLTGRDDTQYMIFGLAVAAAGLLVLLGARSSGDVPLPATTMSMSFMCAHCERGAMFRTPHGLLCRTHTRDALDRDIELWLPKRLDRDDS